MKPRVGFKCAFVALLAVRINSIGHSSYPEGCQMFLVLFIHHFNGDELMLENTLRRLRYLIEKLV